MSTSIELLQHDPLSASEEDIKALLDSVDEDEGDQAVDKTATAGGGQEEKGSKESPIEKEGEKPPEAKAPPEKTPEPKLEEFDPRNVVVKTADGKHEIPYSAYDSARKRATTESTARRAAEESAATERAQREIAERALADLQAQLVEAKKGASAPAADVAATDEAMESLKEAAPELYQILKASKDELAAVKAENASIRQRTEQVEQSRLADARKTANDRVEEAISNQPKIVHVRENDVDRYNAICGIDDILRSQPESQFLPVPQRISKALAIYEELNGKIDVPGLPTPAAKVPAAPAPAAAPASVAAPAAAPHTLSDMHGGGLPASSEMDNIEGLTQHQLEQKLMNGKMTPEQIFEYVGKLPLS